MQKKTKEQVEALKMALRTILKQPEEIPRENQVKRNELPLTVEGRGTSSRIPQASKPHPAPCRICKGPHWRRDCPQRRRFQGSDSHSNQDWRCLGGPHTRPKYTWGTQVLITVEGQSVDFLLDTGATFSVLTEAPGPLSSQSASVVGLSGLAKRYYFSCSLSYNCNSVLFSHEFLIVSVSLSLLLGKDILSTVHHSVFMNMEPSLSLPLIEQNVNTRVGDDEKSVGQEQNAIPVVVKIKENNFNPWNYPQVWAATEPSEWQWLCL